MTFTVQMWMTCPSTDPAVLIEFRKRWTPALQAAWAAISCSSTVKDDLPAELNNRIKTDCAQHIANDVYGGDVSKVHSVDALLYDNWIEGSGGLHSGHRVIRAFPLTGTGSNWTFAANGNSYTISVACGFSG